MLGLIPVLAITLVFVARNPVKVSAIPSGQNTPSVAASEATALDMEIDWKIPPLYIPGDRDPMQLPPPPTTPTPEGTLAPPVPAQSRIQLSVSGVLYSPDRPAAIVETRLVHEGDVVSGAMVKKIEMNSIEFEMNGRTWKQAVEKE